MELLVDSEHCSIVIDDLFFGTCVRHLDAAFAVVWSDVASSHENSFQDSNADKVW